MASKKIVRFTVSGRGDFPFDMLRYDACFPVRPEDARDLEGREQRTLLLESRSQTHGAPMAPTLERWRSFGWVVELGT